MFDRGLIQLPNKKFGSTDSYQTNDQFGNTSVEHRNVHIRNKRESLPEYLAIKGTWESSVKFCATAYANDSAIQILPTMSTRKIKTTVATNWKKL